jgi:hypothetical protein
MSISMKLDATAVRAMIGDKEEFRLELQAAVIQEVVRGLYDKSIPGALRQLIDTAMSERKHELTQAVAADHGLMKHFDDAMLNLVSVTRSSTNSYAASRQLAPEVAQMINARVSAMITEQVDKRTAELGKIIGDMMERIERNAEAKMEAQLEKFDQAYHDLCMKAVMEKFVNFATN